MGGGFLCGLCVVCGLSVWCGVVWVVGVWVETVSISLLWLMQHFPRLGFNATALDSVGCGQGRCKAAPRKASGASWRGTGKGPCNRSAMAAAGTRRGKALYQEALAQLTIRFDHRSR